MLIETGVPTIDDMVDVVPPIERLKKGPVAIIECFQEIPCNPCYTSCPAEAIGGMDNINNVPVLDYDKCIGCGSCITACPGLAIFVVDYLRQSSVSKISWNGKNAQKGSSIIRIPYEFSPLPKEGDMVIALNREGITVGEARVFKVQSEKSKNKTAVVWLEVDRGLVMEIRNFKMGCYYGG